MSETRYGIISDVHQDPRTVTLAVDVLKRAEVEKLLINGDIGGYYGDLKQSQNYTAFILEQIGKSGLESFVQPGSHETLLGYGSVVEYFSGNDKGKYSNVINCLKMPKLEVGGRGHDLVFLPGSDFVCGGEYQIGNNEGIPTRDYVNFRDQLIPINKYIKIAQIERSTINGVMHYSNMNDLRMLVSNPDKTIVVCHVPRKFDNLENCVDMAEFGKAVIDFPLNEKIIEKGSVFPIDNARKIVELGCPIALKRENRGNIDLKNLYDELGITKAVSGHFHESVHRANDRNGNHVKENEMVDELFWNASYLDGLKVGILTVNENMVSYRNINLRDYL